MTSRTSTDYTSTVKAPLIDAGKAELLVGKPWWREVYQDFIAAPLKAFKAAYENSGGRGTIHIHDVKGFLRDADNVTLRRRHQAAAKALYAKQYPTFLMALDAAKRAFKRAKKPKRRIAKGAQLIVKLEDIKNEMQLAAIKALAARKKCTLTIVGREQQRELEKTQEQGRKR